MIRRKPVDLSGVAAAALDQVEAYVLMYGLIVLLAGVYSALLT